MNHGTEGYADDGPEREIVPPTHDDLSEADYSDSDYVTVESDADPSWRHGCYMSKVWRRKSDDTYWAASYRRSTDGDTNELRDGECDINRVYPVTKTIQVTEYVTKDKL